MGDGGACVPPLPALLVVGCWGDESARAWPEAEVGERPTDAPPPPREEGEERPITEGAGKDDGGGGCSLSLKNAVEGRRCCAVRSTSRKSVRQRGSDVDTRRLNSRCVGGEGVVDAVAEEDDAPRAALALDSSADGDDMSGVAVP